MREHIFEMDCLIPAPLDRAFAFFSDAMNLAKITPAKLNFRVLTPPPIVMRVGTEIDYKIRVRGVPISWKSRITAWEPGKRFVDEQVKGPYLLWVHEHRFQETPEGTRMHDQVRYATPMDWLVHSWLVGPDIRRIFEHRTKVILEHFGNPATAALNAR
jgi:ligand-binding SRPBCC domain-containing protein